MVPAGPDQLPLEFGQGQLSVDLMHRGGRMDDIEVEEPVRIVRNGTTAETGGRERSRVQCRRSHLVDTEQSGAPVHDATGPGEIGVSYGQSSGLVGAPGGIRSLLPA
jgi:hypothetical protein